MFKNVIMYRIAPGWSITAEEVEARLQDNHFVECGASQEKSVGWSEPRGEANGPLLEVVAGQWIMKLMVETRALPASVVNRKAEERVAQIEASTGRKPGKKETRDLKDDIRLELMPMAFTKQGSTRVWIDREANLLVTDAGSQGRADELVTLLVQSLPGLALSLINTKVSPSAAMAGWLVSQEAPQGFSVDRECELKAADESKAVVRYARHSLDIDEVKQHMLPSPLSSLIFLLKGVTMKVFNISSSRGLRFFWPSLLIYLATASSALAQMPACGYFDSFVDGETGTFVDPRDGLIWAQCALGQGLISNSCKGRPMKLSWSEAMQAAKNYRQNGHADWRLPSLDELRNVTVHGFKQVSSCKFNGGRFSQRFGKQLGDVWSYNLNTFEEVVRGGGSAGVYNFSTWSSGDAGYKIPTSEQNVWLVRGGSPSNSVQFSEAYTAILKSEQYLRDVAAEKVKIQAESERSAREYEAKQAKDLAAFNSLLRSTNPRGMYLSAVKLEDSGDRGKAKTVYREMINRFPNAQETLLASQRLMRLGDVEAVESSNNDAVSRAEAATQGLRTQNYQQCIAEESSCYSRCSDIKNSSAASNCRGGCYRGCKQ